MSDTVEKEFEPNLDYLDTLLQLGIYKDVATEALFCTGNQSVDAAIDFIFGNDIENTCKFLDSAQEPKFPENVTDDAGSANEGVADEDYFKMTFVVNTSLQMGVGKLSAQVAHACLGLFRKMTREGLTESLDSWEFSGEKKIVLKGIDHGHLQELHEKALTANIPSYLIIDAGKTQIRPNSVTVLSLFGSEEEIDKITGKLSLL